MLEPIILDKLETKNFSVKFTIFYDEDTVIQDMLFDYIRIYESDEDYENGEAPIDDFAIKIKF